MNRTIKFRGKSIYGEDWLYGSLVKIEKNRYAVIPPLNNIEIGKSIGMYEVYPETVGQFTGLLDKDGKEIYEGDILHTITFGFNPEEYTAIILYRNCSFQLSNGRNLFYFGQSDLTKMDDTIVIGNIYDNPDLIKEE
jgi:uncharacterized phage protein (TIGR01671 family)|nr:MAG TPA: YopX protein [Caudoviricetes sp.]